MVKQPDDDLFAGSTMTFGEHIEELRVCLGRALMGLLLGFLIGLFVASYVVAWIQTPLTHALENHYIGKAVDDLTKEYSNEEQILSPQVVEFIKDKRFVFEQIYVETAEIQRVEDLLEQHYGPHPETDESTGMEERQLHSDLLDQTLRAWRESPGGVDRRQLETDEMRRRYGSGLPTDQVPEVIVWEASDQARLLGTDGSGMPTDQAPVSPAVESEPTGIPNATDTTPQTGEAPAAESPRLLILGDNIPAPHPVLITARVWRPINSLIKALSAQEAFMIWLKAAFVSGLVLASPYIFYQLWLFVAAGLYPHEKQYVYLYLPISTILFLAGAALAFFVVFEYVLSFLFGFNKMMNIDPDPRISEWLGFVLFLPLGFGIAFQLPLVMLFLHRVGIFTIEAYLEKWRIAVLVIFIISMFLTPADPVSMLLMALPLTGLYFLGIGMCLWMPRNRSPFSEGYDP